jgi:hypothetical protein
LHGLSDAGHVGAQQVMTNPSVCCICPYHIPDYVERARACFNAQTYPNKRLLAVDTSAMRGRTIGSLRNELIEAAGDCDLIAHWDHDDWSHPERLNWQIEYLLATGAPVVGYQDMPFYDEQRDQVTFYQGRAQYYALGTSLLYQRSLWETFPFPDVPNEDTGWLRAIPQGLLKRQTSVVDNVPRMFATIHKRNTSPMGQFPKASPELERAVRAIIGCTKSLSVGSIIRHATR